MSESNADKVQLQGIEGKALLQLVDYVYTSQIEVTEENVQALLPAASLLEVFVNVENFFVCARTYDIIKPLL